MRLSVKTLTHRLPLVVALVLAVGGCAQAKKPQRPARLRDGRQRGHPCRSHALIATGTVEPIQTATVGSQVGGMSRASPSARGTKWRRARCCSSSIHGRSTRLEHAEARSRAIALRPKSARNEAERTQQLFSQQIISQGEWDQARAASEAATAPVRADSAEAVTARLNVEYASIRAPISGRTGRMLVHVGDYVKAASTDPLVTIHQLRPVRVAFTVPDNAVPLVQKYRNARPRVKVRAAGDDSEWIDGDLVFVDNGVDAASGTLLLKGEFANQDGRLVPGPVRGRAPRAVRRPHATVVPAPAVTNGQQGTYVYVVNAGLDRDARPVTVSRTMDELTVVSDGLKPGETVVTDGQLRLSPGRARTGEAESWAATREHLRTLHPAAGHDHAGHDRHPAVRGRGLPAAAGERPAERGLPDDHRCSASLPGASPETMASAVATPLEKQFSTIAGLDAMTSTSTPGRARSITLQFTLDRNIDAAAQDVQAAIAQDAAPAAAPASCRRRTRR